jgi:glycine/D-amino acid oxidase-like deaminating enzyme
MSTARISAKPPPLVVDAVIVGGGIAGLWLANLLRQRGYAAVLLEANALGGTQTLASQGMIHGGIKYALGGALTGASEAIAGMPGRWADCLAGRGDVDLTSVTRLADRYHLFAAASSLGKLTTFFASRALRGRIERLQPEAYPPAFADPGFRGVVYALNDVVLDTRSLVAALHAPVADRVYRHELRAESLIGPAGNGTGIEIDLGGTHLLARRLVLTAGAGAKALLDRLGVARPRLQLRPLHQVIVRHQYPHPIYAHCLTGIHRPEPRLTITSHPDRSAGGKWLWYLGGQIASDGAAMDAAALVRHARAELDACVPWVDWSGAEFSTVRIDRAEPAQETGRRPDQAFAQAVGDCIVAWPTKLTLAPDLGDRVLALLPPPDGLSVPPLQLPAAPIGQPPWSR